MTHIPVLLNETIDNLCINPNGTYVDATYGAGGHTRLILSKINKGRVIAFDQDNHILKTNTNADKRLEIINQNFIYLQNNLSLLDIDKVDGIIADLGLSSFQISSKRGFSYKHDSDLDMRMNPDSDVSAQDMFPSRSTTHYPHHESDRAPTARRRAPAKDHHLSQRSAVYGVG